MITTVTNNAEFDILKNNSNVLNSIKINTMKWLSM